MMTRKKKHGGMVGADKRGSLRLLVLFFFFAPCSMSILESLLVDGW